MTKEEILAMVAGDYILDKSIHELVTDRPLTEFETLPCYSTDISAAWLVVEKMKDELFSRRMFFLTYLKDQTLHVVSGTEERVTIAWPDVFFHITPETICKAALMAKYSQ